MIIDNTIETLQGVDFLEGQVLLIDKQLHWTSFDIVNKIRYMIRKTYSIKKLKVGHAGTLDPLASGVVVVGIGKETKNLMTYQNQEKEYIAEITFGAVTKTFDLESEPEGKYNTSHITKELIESVLREKFTGTITQIPPIYSAKNVQGVRAYIAARKGTEIEIQPQQVTIYNAELLEYSNLKATIKINCSKGTYIRSIANDLGIELHSGAYLSSLQRTKSGGFTIERCMQIPDFEKLLEIQ